MSTHIEGQLLFSFQDSCHVVKLDDWQYYKKHLTNFADGCKAVDFVAFDKSTKDLWLIEVKDYRSNRREKKQPLLTEFVEKVRDSLSLLVIGKACQIEIFDSILIDRIAQIRVALHIEQTNPPSKLFPAIVNVDNVQLTLKHVLKKATVRPLVLNINQMKNKSLPWTVTTQ